MPTPSASRTDLAVATPIPGTEVISILIWELWENGQYVELSALGVLMIAALCAIALLAYPIAGRIARLA